LGAFEQLLNDFERDGIKVIFVQVPGYLYGRDDQNISKNVQLLRGIAEKRGIPFLDYETKRISSINSNADLFADWTHMNEKGSEAFSKLLKQDLESLLKRM
jgi:lysophospholipase L1-like esterase